MPIEIAGFVTGELVRSYAGFKTGRGKESPPMFNACEQLRPFISYQVKMVAKFDGKKMVVYIQARVRCALIPVIKHENCVTGRYALSHGTRDDTFSIWRS